METAKRMSKIAVAAGPLGSLPLAMTYHWVGNSLFQVFFLAMAAFGVG